ncbi:hypothetical protein GDN83_21030 [Gordonia jinghuaiqii]|uniref:Uncharacterized protein n=1 Tax=Gordonia jinghuaiqii TaxID=2758710 RepID=A0A7D7QQC9_9ACTN|nr:hypothetical protein [Gordonia jinghuaiqii]MCR5980195.1 hypothetical protein [Gordonia jinghuaiqii]QMT02046.1 hypothetical protein H1R19_02345 [Gordonia jinghuaiqii]
MSDFIRKIKDEAKAVSAAIDQELTVLEGVPGYDPLADNHNDNDNDNTDDKEDVDAADDASRAETESPK